MVVLLPLKKNLVWSTPIGLQERGRARERERERMREGERERDAHQRNERGSL